ncbi:conjugal transfer protein TraO [Cellulophaga baltica]|uniref:conjugal transfer protein TraO n=1 Tax=Cellulophaga TaxID=104264 RepID=UPI001C07AF15|nr:MULTISPECIES: conjugal transfer protein TraO [Cellulophaga]MBU2997465.1 conjugal transfer protein TraO [Cellulophaga baltica]MDO6768862.1 conjugal transfer protein TraO [Cellulophaga sp. 1_MG-2023]
MKYFLILFGFLVTNFLSAQAFPKSVMATGGIFGDGYGGEITFNNNIDEFSFTQIALDVSLSNYESGEVSIPYSSYTLSYSYYTTLYATARRYKAISMGIGLLGGYELVNGGQNEFSNIVFLDGDSKFIYGAQAGLEIDIIISNTLSVVAKTTEFYHMNSDFGQFTNYSGLGIRYYFF